MPNCFVINFIHKFVCLFKIVVIAALTHLGLLKQPQQGNIRDADEDERTEYVLLIDRRCPIPVHVSVKILTAIIKKKLAVKKFGSIEDGDEECICPVCLDSVRKRDEIRELCNCNHVFHKECLDTWVDGGNITCPLCRSMLFPDNILASQRKTLLAAAAADSLHSALM